MTNFIKLTLLLTIATTSSISRTKTIEFEPLPDAVDQNVYDKKWEKYGAYYDKDQLVITNSFKTLYHFTTFEIFKKIRILTVEGSQHGTIPVHRWAKKITHFELHHYNAKGEEVPIPIKKIKKKYEKSGKIVFPKVSAGSTITLNIVFKKDHFYYAYFDRWIYYHHIPKRIRRMVFSYNHNSTYEYKTYGNRVNIHHKELSNKYFKSHLFLIHDFEPRPDLDFLDDETKTEPRIVFRLTQLDRKNLTLSDIKRDLIKICKKEIDEITSNLIKEIFKDTIFKRQINTSDTLECAKNILKWIQNNGSSAACKRIVRGKLVPFNNASNLNITSLCYKMFKKVGLTPKILLTPSKNIHIRDSTFLLLSSDYSGFPVLTIQGKTYVAYPYALGYELGEYPLKFKDVFCLDLQDNTIYTLPPPFWGEEWIKDRIVLDLSRFPGNYTLIREFKKNSSSKYRNEFLTLNKSKQRNKLEDVVKHYTESNIIDSFSFKNLHSYYKPFSIIVNFKNNDMPIQHDNKNIFKLTNFTYNHFEDITPERKEDIFIHNKSILIDELEILKISGKKIILNIEAIEINNKLFSAKCNQIETETSYIFQRIISYNKNHIPKEEIEDIYSDCVKLNNIKNSSITILE